MSDINTSRRHFMKQGGTLSAAAASPWLLNLAAIANASAAVDSSGYKALVCVFLNGGNDACNTILPALSDTAGKARYLAVRSQINAHQGANPTITSGTNVFPLHSALSGISKLYASGQLGVVANVGNISQPITRAQFEAGAAVPPRLRSHNDQQGFWQSGQVNFDQAGWGGRVLQNMSSPVGLASNFRSVVIGNNVAFGVSEPGANMVRPFGLVARDQGIPALLGAAQNKFLFDVSPTSIAEKIIRGDLIAPRPNLIEQDYIDVMKRALDSQKYLSDIMGPANVLADDYPLTKDLKMVARVIQAHQNRNMRQVFFVSLGGFDTHSGHAYYHERLLLQLDQALSRFSQALGDSLSKQVLTFTASDFGRLLHSNGDGTDHGWGGHQFVMGGNLPLGKVFGDVPSYAFANDAYITQQITNDGALIPTISIQSYAAALGKWLGLDGATLNQAIFPANKTPLSTFASGPYTDSDGVLRLI